MAITKPPVLPPWADSGDKVQPTNAEIESGWPAGSVPPSRQRFNWILNFCANAVRYFSRRGLVDYDSGETYMTGDIVRGDDGLVYRSLQDTNLNHTPSSSAAWWGAVQTKTAATSDNTTNIATTAWVRASMSNIASAAGFVVSFGTYSYVKLPSWLGGVIFQWGVFTSSGSAGAAVPVVFATAFPNSVRALVLTSSLSSATTTTAWYDGLLPGGFNGRSNAISNSVSFFAVGD